jgi:hypothetical protein
MLILVMVLSLTRCAPKKEFVVIQVPAAPTINRPYNRDTDCNPDNDSEFEHVDKPCNNRVLSVT